MSIIIIAFPAAPKVDPEAQKKDEELNKLLKQKVEGKPLSDLEPATDRKCWLTASRQFGLYSVKALVYTTKRKREVFVLG